MPKRGKRWLSAYNQDANKNNLKPKGRKCKGERGRASMDNVCSEPVVDGVAAWKGMLRRKRKAARAAKRK